MAKILIIFLLFFSSLLLADDSLIDLGNGNKITQAQLQELIQKFKKTQEDKILYHWTSHNTGIRWALQGSFNKGEMDVYNIPTGVHQNSGAGLYLATNPTSSDHFGPMPVVFRIKKGTPIYDDRTVMEVLKHGLTKNEKTELGKHIPFLRAVSRDDWYITHHPQNSSDIVYAGIYNARMKPETIYDFDKLKLYQTLWDGVRSDPYGLTMESHFHLMHYQDGLSYARALAVNPENPWAEFEPKRFEDFRATRIRLMKKIIDENDEIGITWDNQYGSGSLKKDAWVKRQIDEILPDIAEGVSGGDIQRGNPYRVEGVRAGGDQQGKTFLATLEQVAELESNPYLTVEYTKDPQGRGLLVQYFYPDAFHYKKLKGRISDELYAVLEASDPDELMADHVRRRALNRRMIGELLEDHFGRFYGKKAGVNLNENNFIKGLMSIHPFDDFNGRTIRMYVRQGNYESGFRPLYFVLSDFDLLINSKRMLNISTFSQKVHKSLTDGVITEFLMAKAEGRAVDFRKAHFDKIMFDAFKAFGYMEGNINLSEAQLEMIRQRRWVELFDEVIGPKWRTSDPNASLKVFVEIKDKALKAEHLANLKKAGFFESFTERGIDELLCAFANEDYGFMGADGRGMVALTVLYQNVDPSLRTRIATNLYRFNDIGISWGHPSFDRFVREVVKGADVEAKTVLDILAMKGAPKAEAARDILRGLINSNMKDNEWIELLLEKVFQKSEWLKSPEGFEMLVDLYKIGNFKTKLDVSKLVVGMWEAGYRWSDESFAGLVLEMVTKDIYHRQSMFTLIGNKDTASHASGRRVMRQVVDNFDHRTERTEDFLKSTFFHRQWVRTDEDLEMLQTLYKKGGPSQKREVSKAVTTMWKDGRGWDDGGFVSFVDMVIAEDVFHEGHLVPILGDRATVSSESGISAMRKVVHNFHLDKPWTEKLMKEALLKKHWLDTDDGFQMVSDLYNKGNSRQKREASKAVAQMWKNGRRWNDKRFASFVDTVVTTDVFHEDHLLPVLGDSETVQSEAGRKAVRKVVDNFDHEKRWVEGLMEEVLSKKHWLETDEGFQMVVDLLGKGNKAQKRDISKVIWKMWNAGYRWSDDKFASFAQEVVSAEHFCIGPMIRVLQQETAARSDAAKRVLRKLVDRFGKKRDEAKLIVTGILSKDYWIKTDEGFQMAQDLFRRGDSKQREKVSEVIRSMWTAGYRWKDKKFADFVLEVTDSNIDGVIPVTKLLAKEESVTSDVALKVIRKLIDKIQVGDDCMWHIHLVDHVLTKDYWLENNKAFKMLMELYKKRNKTIVWLLKKMKKKLIHVSAEKPCGALITGFLF